MLPPRVFSKTLSGSLRCALVTGREDGGQIFVSGLNHLQVDLSSVLGDGVASEIASSAQALGLVAEALLFCAFFLVDDTLSFVAR